MAATINVTCTECETTIKASAEVEGKKVRCKSCGAVFVATAGKPAAAKAAAAKAPAKPAKPAAKPAAPAPPEKKDDEQDDDGKAYGVTYEKLGARCPECANEMESEDAKICLHCGYNTMTRQRAEFKKVYDLTAMDYLIHLAPGIACLLGIIGLVIYDIMYVTYAEDWFEGESWYLETLRSGAIKMWSCLISVAFMFYMAKFAIRRLIIDRRPPEVEKKK